ncbi:MAG: hypothetical protein PHV23_01385 [Candidatus Gracilibacteria bacterium]|nr:hypothetical protein [Candidatus Gracilibacteria bacterium]
MDNIKNFIGFANNSNIEEDVSFLNLNLNGLKAQGVGIYGKSGVGKTFLVSSIVTSLVKSSIETQLTPLNTLEPDTFIMLDPHNSNIPLILELYKKMLDNNKLYSRESLSYLYSKNGKDNQKVFFDGYTFHKKLIFNPIFSKELNNNLDRFDIFYNFIINGIKNYVGDFSAFGARNQSALEIVIKGYMLFNIENNNLGMNKIYSLKDVYIFFDTLMQKISFPSYISEEFKKLINSKNEKIKSMGDELYNSFKSILNNIKENKLFYETAITKLSIFNQIGETLGHNLLKENLTLDFFKLITEKKIDVEIHLFNLEDFSSIERKLIQGFLNSGAYIFGALKNHLNKNLGYTYIFQDEFQSFLDLKGGKNYLINELEKITNEHRKKKVIFCLIFQFIVEELKELLNNFGIHFIFALPDYQSRIFTTNLTNGIKGNLEITEKHIANLGRGEFYASIDTNTNGLCTIFGKSFNLNNEKHTNLLVK